MQIIKSLIQKLTNNQDRNQDGSEEEPNNDIGELTREDLFRGNFILKETEFMLMSMNSI